MTEVPSGPTAEYGVKSWVLGQTPWLAASAAAPAARVIIDNDFAGDPDDLYQLVHHLLSPSVEISLVVASHLRPDDPFNSGGQSATDAATIARDVFARMGLKSAERIVQGSDFALVDTMTPQPAPAVDAIVAEAMRDDTDLPLFYAAGGGLTDLASALLTEPRIAKRMTLVWIGGNEHFGLALPPEGAMPVEYNLLIDIDAGSVVFDAEDLEIWQVPRNVYRQCLVSQAELRARVETEGALGAYLYRSIADEVERVAGHFGGAGETYALGDSPLVLFTALRSLFEPDTSSSSWVSAPTPAITSTGTYRLRNGSRPMRIYTHVDTRLMFDDMFIKIGEFVRWSESQ